MYVTPVIYPVKFLDPYPVIKQLVLWCIPISGVIINLRQGLLGQGLIDWQILGISLLMSFVYFIFGLFYFHSTERHFADIV
jgi:ABC-type polysaccharide/polyol phosphate export permease